MYQSTHPFNSSLAQVYIRAVFTDEGCTVYSAPHVEGRTYDIDFVLLPAESCVYHSSVLSQYVASYNVSVTKLTGGDGDAPVCGQSDGDSADEESDDDDGLHGGNAGQVVEEIADLSAGTDRAWLR